MTIYLRVNTTAARRTCLAASLFLFVCAMAAAQQPPPVREVADKVIARAEWSEKQKFEKKYAHRMVTVTEKLDSDGNVTEREERVFDVIPQGNGESQRKLISVNGKPPSEDQLKEERELQDKRREEREKRSRKKKDDDPDDDLKLSRELFDKYTAVIIGTEPVNGRPAWIMRFEPRPKLAVRKRMDRVLNKCAGTAWVDTETYELARVEMHLVDEVSIGGFVGKISKLNLRFEQLALENDVWLPKSVHVEINGRVLFKSISQRQQATWESYQKVQQAASR